MLLEIEEWKNVLQKTEAMSGEKLACPSTVEELLKLHKGINGKHSTEMWMLITVLTATKGDLNKERHRETNLEAVEVTEALFPLTRHPARLGRAESWLLSSVCGNQTRSTSS